MFKDIILYETWCFKPIITHHVSYKQKKNDNWNILVFEIINDLFKEYYVSRNINTTALFSILEHARLKNLLFLVSLLQVFALDHSISVQEQLFLCLLKAVWVDGAIEVHVNTCILNLSNRFLTFHLSMQSTRLTLGQYAWETLVDFE